MAKSTPSLVDLARKAAPKQRGWFANLMPEHQKALLDLKADWNAKPKKITISYTQLYNTIIKPNVPGVGNEKAVREWINSK